MSSVLLPHPLGPVTATRCPGDTVRSALRSTGAASGAGARVTAATRKPVAPTAGASRATAGSAIGGVVARTSATRCTPARSRAQAANAVGSGASASNPASTQATRTPTATGERRPADAAAAPAASTAGSASAASTTPSADPAAPATAGRRERTHDRHVRAAHRGDGPPLGAVSGELGQPVQTAHEPLVAPTRRGREHRATTCEAPHDRRHCDDAGEQSNGQGGARDRNEQARHDHRTGGRHHRARRWHHRPDQALLDTVHVGHEPAQQVAAAKAAQAGRGEGFERREDPGPQVGQQP